MVLLILTWDLLCDLFPLHLGLVGLDFGPVGLYLGLVDCDLGLDWGFVTLLLGLDLVLVDLYVGLDQNKSMMHTLALIQCSSAQDIPEY